MNVWFKLAFCSVGLALFHLHRSRNNLLGFPSIHLQEHQGPAVKATALYSSEYSDGCFDSSVSYGNHNHLDLRNRKSPVGACCPRIAVTLMFANSTTAVSTLSSGLQRRVITELFEETRSSPLKFICAVQQSRHIKLAIAVITFSPNTLTTRRTSLTLFFFLIKGRILAWMLGSWPWNAYWQERNVIYLFDEEYFLCLFFNQSIK